MGNKSIQAQYLKVYDVTPPANAPGLPTIMRPNSYGYVIENGGVTYSWAPVGPDAEGIQSIYKVTYQINNQQPDYFFTSATSNTFQLNAGNTLTVFVQAVNPNDLLNANTPTGPSSGTISLQVIAAGDDIDGDGNSNAQEDIAGTNPFDATSALGITGLTKPDAGSITVTWESVAGKTYRVEGAPSPGGTFAPIAGSEVTAASPETFRTVATGAYSFFRIAVVEP